MVNLAQRVFDDTRTWMETDRDLNFRPAHCAQPHTLTQEQIRFYNEQGYVKGLRVFTDPNALCGAGRVYIVRRTC